MKAALLPLLFLTGCGTSSVVYDIEGNPSHLIDCSGKSRTFASCEAKAAEICSKTGYRVLETDHKPQLIAVPDGFRGVRNIVADTRTMLIQCN